MSNLGKKDSLRARHLSVGKMGENIACEFLRRKKFKIIDRNVYIHNVGELDIVAKKNGRVHVVEVKTLRGKKGGDTAFTQMHPLENLTHHKLEKLKHTAILYTKQNNTTNWQLDAVSVWYDDANNKALVDYSPSICS